MSLKMIFKRFKLRNNKILLGLVALALVAVSVLGFTLLADFRVKVAQAASLADFVIRVKTDNPGISSPIRFTIPTLGSGSNYNVDCNDDGTIEAFAVPGNYTCTYATAGTYTIAIKDNTGLNTGFPSINFLNLGDQEKLLSIEQWGSNKWLNMTRAFHGAKNMVLNATDTPDLSTAVFLGGMFQDATNFVDNGGAMNNWNTSNVINYERYVCWCRQFQPTNWILEH